MSHDEMRFLRREIINNHLIEHLWLDKHGYNPRFSALRFWVRMAEISAYDCTLNLYEVQS